LAFAGEWAGFTGLLQPLYAKPKKLKPLGERGELILMTKKGKPYKLVPEKVEIEVSPRLTKAMAKELPAAMREAAKIKPKPVPGQIQIEVSPRLTKAMVKELPKAAREAARIRPKPVPGEWRIELPKKVTMEIVKEVPKVLPKKPLPKPKMTMLEKGAYEDLVRAYGGMVQKVKVAPKIKQVVKPAAAVLKPPKEVLTVAKPTVAEAKAVKSVFKEITAAERARYWPTITKATEYKAYYEILGSYRALTKGMPKYKPAKEYVRKEFAFALAKSPLEKQLAKTVAKGPMLGEYVGEGISPRLRQAMKGMAIVIGRRRVITAPKERERIEAKAITLARVRELAKTRAKVAVKEAERVITIPKAIPITRPRAKVTERVTPAEKALTRAIQIQRTRVPTQITLGVVEEPERLEIKEEKRPKPVPTYLFPRRRVEEPIRPIKKFVSGFEVFVRKAGEFVRVSPYPLARKAALGLGARETEAAARTFFIRPVKAPGVKIPALERWWKPWRFRRPVGKTVLPPGAFVEKAEFAIDVPREYEEITMKGIAARRRGVGITLTGPKARKKKKTKKTKRRK